MNFSRLLADINKMDAGKGEMIALWEGDITNCYIEPGEYNKNHSYEYEGTIRNDNEILVKGKINDIQLFTEIGILIAVIDSSWEHYNYSAIIFNVIKITRTNDGDHQLWIQSSGETAK